jgi:hypothetical protein
MTHKKLRDALRVKYGSRCYRITRTGDVHVYSPMPNSRVTGWWLMGEIDHAYTWMGLDA